MDSRIEIGEGLYADIAALHPAGLTMAPIVWVALRGRYRGEAPDVDDDWTRPDEGHGVREGGLGA
ncbi:MAG: hypothetical protein P8R54_24230 [Myxococcota bacterium]|nr:hypothetical protein [Myxococcota bacterium]